MVILITLLCNKHRRWQKITTKTSVHLWQSSNPVQMECLQYSSISTTVIKLDKNTHKKQHRAAKMKFIHTNPHILLSYLWNCFCVCKWDSDVLELFVIQSLCCHLCYSAHPTLVVLSKTTSCVWACWGEKSWNRFHLLHIGFVELSFLVWNHHNDFPKPLK